MRSISFTIRLWCLAVLIVGGAAGLAAQSDSIYFVQLSDTHWGFNNPKINPDFAGTLKKAVADINRISGNPDFIVFTGDETHITNDPKIREQRMADFKQITSALKVKSVKYLPGEHDANQDNGKDYMRFFGPLHYSFDLKGVHFVAIDNVSTPDGSLGDEQLAWFKSQLDGFKTDSQIVLFAHRPLIDVYAPWSWMTKDGARALELLKPFKNVTLFYGHIHQLRKDSNGDFTQYAAKGMMFPLPAPGSKDTPSQVPWDAKHPYQGLGFRTVKIDLASHDLTIREYGITDKEDME